MNLFGLKIELEDKTPLLHRRYLKRKQIPRGQCDFVKGLIGHEMTDGFNSFPPEIHFAYEEDLQLPYVITRIEERIFNGLPKHLARPWPEQFLRSLKGQYNMAEVWLKFAAWLIEDPIDGVIRFEPSRDRRQNLLDVADLCAQRCNDAATWENALEKIARGTFFGEIFNNSAMGAASEVGIKIAVASYQGLMAAGDKWAARSPLTVKTSPIAASAPYAAKLAAGASIWAVAAHVLNDKGQHRPTRVEAEAWTRQSQKFLELLKAE